MAIAYANEEKVSTCCATSKSYKAAGAASSLQRCSKAAFESMNVMAIYTRRLHLQDSEVHEFMTHVNIYLASEGAAA